MAGTHPKVQFFVVSHTTLHQENQHFYLQLELCEGGTLQNLLDFAEVPCILLYAVLSMNAAISSWQEPLPAPKMKDFWSQLCSGLAHIHNHEMLHLDLKPENIFIVGTITTRLPMA